MSRGVTLHEKEMRQIFDLMKKRRMGNRFKKEEPQQDLHEQAVPAEMNDGFMQSTVPEEPFDVPVPQDAVPEEQLEQAVF